MACDVNDIELMRALIDSVSNNNDITSQQKKEIIKSMLEQEHVNYYSGYPLLVYAVEAEECNIDMVKFLINTYKEHVDNNLLTFINATNEAKATALMLAVFHNKFDVAKYLIEEGANVNLRSIFGGTALFDTLHKDVFWGGQTANKIVAQKKLLQTSLRIANILCEKLDNLDAQNHEMGNILKAALGYFCQSIFSAYQDYSENLLKIIVQHMHKMTADTICDFLSSDPDQLIKMLENQDLRQYLSFENIAKLIANHDKYSGEDKLKICKAWIKLLTEVSNMKQTLDNCKAIDYATEQLNRYTNMKKTLYPQDDATMLGTFMQYQLKSTASRELPPISSNPSIHHDRLGPVLVTNLQPIAGRQVKLAPLTHHTKRSKRT